MLTTVNLHRPLTENHINTKLINWFSYNDHFTHWAYYLKKAEINGWDYNPSNKECLHKWRQRLFKAGTIIWSDERKNKNLFKPGTQQIISDIFKKYILEKPSILEIGSNQLNDRGESALSEMIPNEYKTEYVYSDCYKIVVAEQGQKTEKKYLHLNATKLSHHLRDHQEGTKDVIVSLNVLVVINRSKFFKIAQEAYESLNPGGVFMILSNNGAHPYSVLDCEEDQIAIPWKKDDSFGEIKPMITIGSREKFIAAIKNAQSTMPKKYSAFFNDFLDLNVLQQRLFMMNAWNASNASNASMDKLLLLFKDFVLLDENSTSFDANESYYTETENALKKAGFEILLNEIQQNSETINYGKYTHINYIMNKITTLTQEHREGIPDKHVAVISHLKVILAQKPFE